MGQSTGPQPNLQVVDADIDPLDEELDYSGLLGGEQLLPERIEPMECFSNVSLRDAGIRLSR